MKVILVFGVFDLLHDGHRHFLREAKKLGNKLVAVISRDETSLILKGKLPENLLAERMENLRKENLADEIIKGDEIIGSWEVLRNVKPDIVALGYDQQNLETELRFFIAKNKINCELIFIKPFGDGSLHSSSF